MAGAGGQLYPEAFGAVIPPAYPDARTLASLVAVRSQVEMLAPDPLYLRLPTPANPGRPSG